MVPRLMNASKRSNPSTEQHQFRRPPPRKSFKRTDRRGPYKPTRHTHWADAEDGDYDDEEDSFGDPDNEDLEREALMAEEDMPDEEEYDDDEGYYDEDEEDLDAVDRGALQEAFSAGWTAKRKTAQQRKGRGYKGDSKSKGKGRKRIPPAPSKKERKALMRKNNVFNPTRLKVRMILKRRRGDPSLKR